MKVDAIVATELANVSAAAVRAEELGCDGMMVPEVAHDPFLPLPLAATATTSLRLSTGIAVAFARNPMNVAVMASDINRLSHGRFALGLGTQIRPHVTRRFSMPWSSPAPKMREFVGAVRAIWSAWQNQTPLDFRGEHYQHTLMTPMFDHGPSEYGWPPILLAGVGPVMTRLAGEIADGFITHGFTTADYVRDATLPQLEVGLQKAGRDRSDFEVTVPAMVAFAESSDDRSLATARGTIAFYGSTPAYRPVLDHHGWSALGEELHAMSKRGEWQRMGALIDDDVLHTFAVVGDPKSVAVELKRRFGGLAERIQLGVGTDDDRYRELIDTLRDA